VSDLVSHPLPTSNCSGENVRSVLDIELSRSVLDIECQVCTRV
jgi:hypothetical protein